MISLTLSLADNFEESLIPSILKQFKALPFYLQFFMNIFDLFMFPYYSMKLLLNGHVHASEVNPFMLNGQNSGLTNFHFTMKFAFEKLHHLNRKLNVSFNDLMLSIISSGINKYCKNSDLNKKYIYSKLICAIPIGVKTLTKDTKDVALKNDILGAITVLERINDPVKEITKISEETKKTVKNSSNIKAWTYLELFFNQFLPYFVQKGIAKNVAQSVDLAISNLPGPNGEILYCKSKVTEILPIMSIGFGKCMIIVGTYNNMLGLTVCVEKDINIDLKSLILALEEEIINAINQSE